MRTLNHLALLVMLAALIVACESEGGGTYDPDAGSGTQIVFNTDTVAEADAPGDQSSGDAGQLPTECAKSAPDGAACNPYCQQGCDTEQHCSHNSGAISCMSYSGQAPGAGCASSLFCEAGSACLTLDAEGGKICHRFCVTNEECWAGAKCTLNAWVEIGLSGEIMSFCQVENDGPPCEPQCVGKQCGDDGCGATCGTCGDDICNDNGQCVSSCTPNCAGKECGSDGCEGTCGNGCTSDQICSDGQCACVPDTCASLGKNCGSVFDGCDSMIDCGQCPDGQACGDEVANVCAEVEPEPGLPWCQPGGGINSGCASDSACNDGLYCSGTICMLECSDDEACGDGAVCLASIGYPQCYKTCANDSDCCPGLGGMVCFDDLEGVPKICVF